MTFEEFFTKKKISLTQLQSGEPSLFAEFKGHYEQMGEKSFDHTKKYWFNQLRRRFPTSADVKVEKVEIENSIAEQTIAESLSEPATAATGFKPRFRAGAATPVKTEELAPTEQTPEVTAEPATTPATGFKPRFKAPVSKPADEVITETVSEDTNKPSAEISTEAKPATGFKPRFKAGVTSKPVEETGTDLEKTEEPSTEKMADAEAPKPTVGFKPRFKAGATKPADNTTPEASTKKAEEPVAEKPTETEVPKPAVGFKPRFKAGVTNKPVEEVKAEPIAEQVAAIQPVEPEHEKDEEPIAELPAESETLKPAVGFKPRFKASMVTKPAGEVPPTEDKVEEIKPAEPVTEASLEKEPEPTSETPAEEKPKPIGFKPRFNAAKMKPKDPEA